MNFDKSIIAHIRREYGQRALNEENLPPSPVTQFHLWFTEALNALEGYDPNAMVLSTVDKDGYPDSRVVLLKDYHQNSFTFYTNYCSKKSSQLAYLPFAAINFFWPPLARQIRIRGSVKKISTQKANEYFKSRPINSQISAIVSPQSKIIVNRDELEDNFNKIKAEVPEMSLTKPENWGGYQLNATEFEFWQGRDNRLHDRIFYYQDKEKHEWCFCRLAP